MNLLNFNDRFPDEKSCRMYLKEQREELGITCKECGNTKHYWLGSIEKWKCSKCGSRTNLRAGSIMEDSKLPVRTWFLTIHLMTAIKKSFSALELQRQLGLKRYEPMFEMMQKIRKAMGKRDAHYKLNGEIEVDDAFFEIVDLPKKDELGNKIVNNEPLKRGRGSQGKMSVLIMVESEANPNQTKPHKKNRIMGYVKMKVMDDLTSIGINYEIEKAIAPTAKVLTDGYRGYNHLIEVIAEHVKMIVPPTEAHKMLPWVHTQISNAKRQFLGTHHSVNREYLQNYLNEFCYKLNRRNFESDMFDRLLMATANERLY